MNRSTSLASQIRHLVLRWYISSMYYPISGSFFLTLLGYLGPSQHTYTNLHRCYILLLLLPFSWICFSYLIYTYMPIHNYSMFVVRSRARGVTPAWNNIAWQTLSGFIYSSDLPSTCSTYIRSAQLSWDSRCTIGRRGNETILHL